MLINVMMLFLEFLISIQHREITPEDYEYLSRLDEMIKRKTVNETILGNLKCEMITESSQITAEDVCGICLENYEIGQTRKQLPCLHKFHGDCIDQWLSSQSTDCPLDKIPVDRPYFDSIVETTDDSGTHSVVFEDTELEVEGCLNELLDKIDLDLSVQQCIENMIAVTLEKDYS